MRLALAALLFAPFLLSTEAQAQGVFCNGQLRIGQIESAQGGGEGWRGTQYSALVTNTTGQGLTAVITTSGLPGQRDPSQARIGLNANQAATVVLARVQALPQGGLSGGGVMVQQAPPSLQVVCTPGNRMVE